MFELTYRFEGFMVDLCGLQKPCVHLRSTVSGINRKGDLRVRHLGRRSRVCTITKQASGNHIGRMFSLTVGLLFRPDLCVSLEVDTVYNRATSMVSTYRIVC